MKMNDEPCERKIGGDATNCMSDTFPHFRHSTLFLDHLTCSYLASYAWLLATHVQRNMTEATVHLRLPSNHNLGPPGSSHRPLRFSAPTCLSHRGPLWRREWDRWSAAVSCYHLHHISGTTQSQPGALSGSAGWAFVSCPKVICSAGDGGWVSLSSS